MKVELSSRIIDIGEFSVTVTSPDEDQDALMSKGQVYERAEKLMMAMIDKAESCIADDEIER